MKIYHTKSRAQSQVLMADIAHGQVLMADLAHGQVVTAAIAEWISEFKQALKTHWRSANVQQNFDGFLQKAARAAEAEQMVEEAVDIFRETVLQSCQSDGSPNASDGRDNDFVFLESEEPVVAADAAIARKRNEAADDAKLRVRAAFDYKEEAFKENRDSFMKTADPQLKLQAASCEDRVLVDQVIDEVYPGRKRHKSLCQNLVHASHAPD